MARVIWSKKVLNDFEGLIDYIANDSPLTARRFAQKMMAKIDLLQAHPHMGGWVLEDDSRTYREILQGAYRIIYRVSGDTVLLVAIHHAARLLEIDELD